MSSGKRPSARPITRGEYSWSKGWRSTDPSICQKISAYQPIHMKQSLVSPSRCGADAHPTPHRRRERHHRRLEAARCHRGARRRQRCPARLPCSPSSGRRLQSSGCRWRQVGQPENSSPPRAAAGARLTGTSSAITGTGTSPAERPRVPRASRACAGLAGFRLRFRGPCVPPARPAARCRAPSRCGCSARCPRGRRGC